MLLEQPVETGDIFRMCQTKDEAIRDFSRAREAARDDLNAAGSLARRALDCLPDDSPALADLLVLGAEALVEDAELIREELERCRRVLDRMAAAGGEHVGEALSSVPVEAMYTRMNAYAVTTADIVINVTPKRNCPGRPTRKTNR